MIKPEFRKELETIINRHSIESSVNMPDFMLADMICNVITTVGNSVKKRDAWMGYTKERVSEVLQAPLNS